MRREFADVVAKRVLPNCDSPKAYIVIFDTSLTEKTFVLAHLRFQKLKTRQRIAALTGELAKSLARLCQRGRVNA